MRDWVQRVVIVVGCQRSGTTLTGQILGAHQDAVLLDEPDGIYKWFRAERAESEHAEDLYREMLELAARKYRDPSDRFDLSGERIGLLPHITTAVLKAPNLTYDYQSLGDLAAPLMIVYPVRDPRSVVSSMMQLKKVNIAGKQTRMINRREGMESAFHLEQNILASEDEPLWVRCAAVWKIKSGLAPEFRRAGLPVFQFRYEDMVQGEDVVARMLDFCKLAPPSAPLQPETVYVGRGPGGTERTRPMDTVSLLNWKDDLDGAKEADVMRIARPLAESFGYI